MNDDDIIHMIGAAILSPTAVLHVFTGISIIFCVMRSRAMEDVNILSDI